MASVEIHQDNTNIFLSKCALENEVKGDHENVEVQ